MKTSEFDDLIQHLADAEWVRRPQGEIAYATKTAFRARDRLIAAGNEAVPAVVDCLTSKGPYNQKALAAQFLGEIGDARAVRALIKMLRHPEVTVRGYSAEALGKIGDGRAVAPLRDMLDRPGENSSVRTYAQGALNRLSEVAPTTATKEVAPTTATKTEKKWWQFWK